MKYYHISELCIRDPFLFYENGKYYLTGSGGKGETFSPLFDDQDAFLGYVSEDLENFYGPYVLFDKWESNEYWAPEIHKYNGKYYLFGTVHKKGERRGTYSFVCDSILGEYTPTSELSLTPSNQEALDGTLVIENDVPYLVYCHEWLQIHNGAMCIIELNKDLSKSIGEPKVLFYAKDAKYVGENDRGGYVTDGPFIRKENGTYKMIWSSFKDKDTYCLGVATSKSLFEGWVLEEHERFDDDRGHGMLIDIDNKQMLVCHKPNHPRGKERLIISEFKF